MEPIYPRVAGRLGNIVSLDMNILRNGELKSPFAIRKIDIFRGSPRVGQLVATILFPDPGDTSYPSLAIEGGQGQLSVPFLVPHDFVPGEIYFDVWSFLGDDPGTAGIDDESLWIAQMGRFWLFDDVWLTDEELYTKRIGFEPLDKKLKRGEIRTIEVAMHPLPMYDYDFNLIAPMIPQLSPTITIHTSYNELIVADVPCSVGIRQGHVRNSPFVVRCLIDTRTLPRGMYKYTIKINMGSEIIMSPKFNFTVQ